MSFQLEPLLNDVKGKNLKLKANCTSLLKGLDQRAQELLQKQQELDRVEQELDFLYISLGESLCHAATSLAYTITGGILNCCIKYFQWPGPSSGGATISLRDRRSKGKGKEIRARDHARGRREEGNACKEAIIFAIPPTY